MSKEYDSTYEGQLEKCGDERSALEQTVDDLSEENKQLRADLAKANARIEALESEASTLEDQIRDLHYERGMEQP